MMPFLISEDLVIVMELCFFRARWASSEVLDPSSPSTAIWCRKVFSALEARSRRDGKKPWSNCWRPISTAIFASSTVMVFSEAVSHAAYPYSCRK
jgi:hypothetical protein